MDQMDNTFKLASDIAEFVASREYRPYIDECVNALGILLGTFLHKTPKEKRDVRTATALKIVAEVVQGLDEQHELN